MRFDTRRIGLTAGVFLAAVVMPRAAPAHLAAQDGDSSQAPRSTAERTALARSLWGTVAPVTAGVALATSSRRYGAAYFLIAGGMTFGPSLGHFYAGNDRRAWLGSLFRVGVGVGALAWALDICWEGCTDSEERNSRAVLLGGAAVIATSAVYDIVRAPDSVRRAQGAVSVGPWIDAGGRPGLSASVRF